MADAHDSKSCIERCVGSSPTSGTKSGMKKKLPTILVICGQTATGKSDLAVSLAQELNGEVISADSRQVYKGLDIGAGKITKREMRGVPHHLLDVADPKRARYTVDDFRRDGTKAIDDILSRGKLPIICGGTGFYIDALLGTIDLPNVPPNQALRKKLEKKSVEALMKEITKLDPRRAKTLDPFNKVRIIRAIEIAKALGKVPKISATSKQVQKYNAVKIGLTLDRDALRAKIHARLIKRMRGGKMIAEASRLHAQGVSWKRMYAFGLEYRHLALHLQGKMTRAQMLEEIENESLAYSKRQMQWLKRDKEITWLNAGTLPKNLMGMVETIVHPPYSR
jgi:tRNA dimethylallyltransferase